MRGNDTQVQAGMFSYVTLEQRVPKNHPLRAVRGVVDEVLVEMSASFESLYSKSKVPCRIFRAYPLQSP